MDRDMMKIFKECYREFIGELIGTSVLMLFGTSGCACHTLFKTPINLPCGIGYFMGLFLGLVFSMPVTGGHLNPAITLALCFIGKFPWRKIPIYFVAQYIGAFVGSFLTWSMYFESIKAYDKFNNYTEPSQTTAFIFTTFPAKDITIVPALLDQVVGTALLAFGALLILSEITSRPLAAATISLLVLALVTSFSYNCGAILNPARDLSPRFMVWVLGYKVAFKPLDYNYWWVVAVIGPHIGAVAGAVFYQLTSRGLSLGVNKENKVNVEDTSLANNSSGERSGGGNI